MSLEVPTSVELSSYSQRTQLDGEDFVLFFQFNERLCRWFVDITDQDLNPIASGLRLTTNFPVGRFIRDARRPKGLLQVVDQQGGGTDQDALNQLTRDAGLFELGDRFVFIYFEADEVLEVLG